ncbi:MAG: histidine kinase [Chitinophagaceae bacterium]|nr:histidine kinase [Chitinophagaceae bacterium]
MFEINNKLKDRYFRIAGIPLSAIVVMLLYSLLTHQAEIVWTVADFFFLLFVASGLWFGNIKIQYIFRSYLYSIKRISLRLLARFAVTFGFSFILSFILFALWNYLLHQSLHKTSTIVELQLISVLISLQVSSIYEIVYLNKERESDIVKIERTEKSKIQAQLDSLKNQVDPHFIFNSLNTLSYLISQNPGSAKLFNDTLARVYRYILIKKEKDLVLLKEEIEFASNYFYLLKIRYQYGLKMTITIDDIVSENYLLPPLSVQILIENAIKHNHFTDKIPLNIVVTVIKDHVTVTNNRNIKQFDIQSSQIGLKNLSERYLLITDKNISINDSKENFNVVLPLLKS